jgi:hypothetical protein
MRGRSNSQFDIAKANMKPEESRMDVKLILRFDGHDEERLREALRQELFRDLVADTLRQLFWWHHEQPDEQVEAYRTVFNFIGSKLSEAGLDVTWQVYGKVLTRDGREVERTEADDPFVVTKRPQAVEASPKPGTTPPSEQTLTISSPRRLAYSRMTSIWLLVE